MSELDLGSAPAAVATAPAPAGDKLVLAPPAPVVTVSAEQAVDVVPLETAAQAALRSKADAFAAELVSIDVKSPAFTSKVASITSMGDAELRSSASVSNRMLERPAAAMGKNGDGNATTRVANTLVQLRTTVTELDPKRADLTGAKRFLKFLPGGDKVNAYFAKYQSAQSHLNAIIKALESGQDELRKDNATIETEKVNMWTTMGKLTEYNELAAALEVAIASKAATLEAQGKTEDANTLRNDALFAVRQRRQDIMTQMAVNVQGYMALDLIRKNNLELIRGVDRAQTTTVAALRTAVIVSQALSQQKLVLDQVNALNSVTSDLIQSTSEDLKQQGAAINEQAASSTVDIAKLQAAFDNVFATMDAIDAFRAQANDSMAATIGALEGQIQKAQPYLARTRAGENQG
ncbi:toxic anion resistance protein [Terracoccus luteus]|uniref:Uncharacterized protein YaaN involved in tellurite resistance n=1 Tax=Terracoccus luteus TaxID=53356 RepID=A0A839Q2A8_9MICO|nr:toxic anion resistance protein [Terracoccus luteus]MBB2988465.1 uncharacterized protein YaaN involved in tellurite resistance [Terracoccus luteus]MCP2174080.1 uncharacterized protein YaaN involved in tellurite resistance [Terracoccus luteus]